MTIRFVRIRRVLWIAGELLWEVGQTFDFLTAFVALKLAKFLYGLGFQRLALFLKRVILASAVDHLREIDERQRKRNERQRRLEAAKGERPS